MCGVICAMRRKIIPLLAALLFVLAGVAVGKNAWRVSQVTFGDYAALEAITDPYIAAHEAITEQTKSIRVPNSSTKMLRTQSLRDEITTAQASMGGMFLRDTVDEDGAPRRELVIYLTSLEHRKEVPNLDDMVRGEYYRLVQCEYSAAQLYAVYQTVCNRLDGVAGIDYIGFAWRQNRVAVYLSADTPELRARVTKLLYDQPAVFVVTEPRPGAPLPLEYMAYGDYYEGMCSYDKSQVDWTSANAFDEQICERIANNILFWPADSDAAYVARNLEVGRFAHVAYLLISTLDTNLHGQDQFTLEQLESGIAKREWTDSCDDALTDLLWGLEPPADYDTIYYGLVYSLAQAL